MERLFTGYVLQGALVGLAALALLAFAPRLQKRYGSRWLCRLWLILAALFLLPVRLLLPAAPTPVELHTPAALTAPVALPTGGQELLPQQETPLKENASAPAAPAAGQGSSVSPPAAPPPAGPGGFSGASRPLAHTPGLRLPAWSPLGWVALVWLAGASGMLLWQALSSFFWKRRVLRCSIAPGAGWQAAFDAAFAASGLSRRPRFLCSGAVCCPLVAGLFRPIVFAPETEPQAPAGEMMLAHELTHIKRRDLAFKCLLLMVRTVHWYDPAAWLLARRAGRDIEAACDEQAVAGREPAYRSAYCDALLCAARMGRTPALSTCFALTKKDMAARFARLWDTSPKRRGLAALAVLGLAAALAGGMVACSEGAAPAELPAATPAATAAPTPMPSPVPDRSGQEEVWPGLEIYPAASKADFFPDVPSFNKAGYFALDGQLIGYATRANAGSAVSFSSSFDGGRTMQTAQFDLTPFLGEEFFQVSNYQMVSENTGFLVLRMTEKSYQTNKDVMIFRTRDGGESWALMGRHACPQDARDRLWHTQPFLWVNENVGFWAPHTRYDLPDVWRTLDGGAHWERLDLSGLMPYIPYEGVPGVHTCSVRLDALAPAPGHIVARCYASPNSLMDSPFDLVSYDYGESWFVRDRYVPLGDNELSAELQRLYCDEAAFTLPPEPTDKEITDMALALLQQAERLARLPLDSTRPSVYQWANESYAQVLYPCACLKTEEAYRAALARIYTQQHLEQYLKDNGLFSGASPHYVTHGGTLYLASDPYWTPSAFRAFSAESIADWYEEGILDSEVERQEDASRITLRLEGTVQMEMTLRFEKDGWRIDTLKVDLEE